MFGLSLDDHWSARGLTLYTRLYSAEELVLWNQFLCKQILELVLTFLCKKSLKWLTTLSLHVVFLRNYDWRDYQLLHHYFMVFSVNRFLLISPFYWSSSTSCTYLGAVLVANFWINIVSRVCHVTTVLWFECWNLLFLCLTALFLPNSPVITSFISVNYWPNSEDTHVDPRIVPCFVLIFFLVITVFPVNVTKKHFDLLCSALVWKI